MPSAGKVDIVVLGYMFKETIKFQDRTIGPVLGGTASYAAVCLGRLGTPAGIVSNIDEETPGFMLEPLQEAGVNLAGLNRRPGISTTETILVYDRQGNKQIEYLKRAPVIYPEDIPGWYYKAKVFHLCEVDFEVPLSTVLSIKKKNPSLKIAADLGGIGGAHSTPEMRNMYVHTENGNRFEQYLGCINYAKASLEDCSKMFNRPFETADRPGQMLLKRGIDTVIITLGAKGSLILTQAGDRLKIPAIEPEGGVVDTTGAGDTFISAFLSEYLVSGNTKKAGYFAAAASSLLIEKTGGVSAERSPIRSLVEKRIRDYCNSKRIVIEA
jgi:ribokinase